jgi:uncharacterized integral membrane protein
MRFEKDRVKKARFKSRYTWALAIVVILIGVITIWTNNSLYDFMEFKSKYPLGPILISSLIIGFVSALAGVIDAETWNDIHRSKASMRDKRIRRHFVRFIELYSEGNYEKANGFYSCVNNGNMRTFLNGIRTGVAITIKDRDHTEIEKRTLSFLEEVVRSHKED